MLLCHCSICQQSFNENCTISALLCGHVFHFDCLTSWLNNKSNCPQCRTSNVGNYVKKLFFDKMPDLNNSFINTNESLIEENLKLRLEVEKFKELNLKMANQLKIKSKSNEQLKKELNESQSSQIKEYLSFTAQICEITQTNEIYKRKLDKLKFMNDIFTKSESEINKLIENLPKDELQIEKLCSALVTCRNDLKLYKKSHDETVSKLAKAEFVISAREAELMELKEMNFNNSSNNLDVSELLDTPVTAMRAQMKGKRNEISPLKTELLLDSPINTLAANRRQFRQKQLAGPFRCTPQKRKNVWNLDIMNCRKPLRAPPQFIITITSDTENQEIEEEKEPVKKSKKRSKHIQPIKRS